MKVVNIVGARPQFIKLAPVLRAIKRYNQKYPKNVIESVIIHTGQHYDYEMSQIFFEELEIEEPDYYLEVGSGSHGHQTGEILKRTEDVLLSERPDLVIVYGDTNSTLGGALAAAKLHIPVAHVEAGLRSFNRQMPEEINRVLTDHISDLLFCPTKVAVENLKREGIEKGVYFVGDVMYDSVLYNIKLAEKNSEIMSYLRLKPKTYALATVHRAGNTDNYQRLITIFQALEKIAKEIMPVILPLHPRTRRRLKKLGIALKNVRIFEPLSYLDMLLLEKNARVILTDSGGVQKEAFFLKVPCITLREETEWIETVKAGWNTLVGCNIEKILEAVQTAKPGKKNCNPYGDGQAADKIVSIIVKGYGV